MRHLGVVLLLAGVCVFAAWSTTQRALAYPEPAPVSPSWSLDVTVQKPAAISIEDVDGSIRWFWYMPYKVVNNTDQDLLFIPEITIANDNGEILTAGQNVPRRCSRRSSSAWAIRCCSARSRWWASCCGAKTLPVRAW